MTKKDVIREELQTTETIGEVEPVGELLFEGSPRDAGIVEEVFKDHPKILILSHEENPRVAEVLEHIQNVKTSLVVPGTFTSTEAKIDLPPSVAMSTLPYPDTRNHGPILNPVRSRAVKKVMKKERQANRPSWRKP